VLISVLKREHKQDVCISVVSWKVNEPAVIVTRDLFCFENLMLAFFVYLMRKNGCSKTDVEANHLFSFKKIQLLTV